MNENIIITLKIEGIGRINAVCHVLKRIKILFIPLFYLIGFDNTINLVALLMKRLLKFTVVTKLGITNDAREDEEND